jgi:hypothetical protein
MHGFLLAAESHLIDGTADLFIRDRQLQLFVDFMDRYIRFLQYAVFDGFFVLFRQFSLPASF